MIPPLYIMGGGLREKFRFRGVLGGVRARLRAREFGDTAGCQTRNDLNSDSFNANSDSFDPNRDSLIDDASKWQGALRPAEKKCPTLLHDRYAGCWRLWQTTCCWKIAAILQALETFRRRVSRSNTPRKVRACTHLAPDVAAGRPQCPTFVDTHLVDTHIGAKLASLVSRLNSTNTVPATVQ